MIDPTHSFDPGVVTPCPGAPSAAPLAPQTTGYYKANGHRLQALQPSGNWECVDCRHQEATLAGFAGKPCTPVAQQAQAQLASQILQQQFQAQIQSGTIPPVFAAFDPFADAGEAPDPWGPPKEGHCVACAIELCWMDDYHGTEEFMDQMCVKCRRARGSKL